MRWQIPASKPRVTHPPEESGTQTIPCWRVKLESQHLLYIILVPVRAAFAAPQPVCELHPALDPAGRSGRRSPCPAGWGLCGKRDGCRRVPAATAGTAEQPLGQAREPRERSRGCREAQQRRGGHTAVPAVPAPAPPCCPGLRGCLPGTTGCFAL